LGDRADAKASSASGGSHTMMVCGDMASA
jgi:hypothetical protein